MILTELATATATAAPSTSTRTASAPWFAAWFDSPHYHTLYAHRSDTEAAAFIDALIDRLQPGDDASILDLGCGAGRHARYLASKGFGVTGLDLSAASIHRAQRFERPGLRFLRHDMRVPFGQQAFDYVFNMFTSFGYFADAAEHQLVVRNIANALQPGGRLVLDYLNVHHAEARLTPAEIKQIDGVTYRVTRWSDSTHFYKRIQIDAAADAAAGEHVERVAKLTYADFDDMFTRCGLSIEAVYGDYALQPYDVRTSPRLILVARRIGG
jgi:SAM-dependent methyltransferase